MRVFNSQGCKFLPAFLVRYLETDDTQCLYRIVPDPEIKKDCSIKKAKLLGINRFLRRIEEGKSSEIMSGYSVYDFVPGTKMAGNTLSILNKSIM